MQRRRFIKTTGLSVMSLPIIGVSCQEHKTSQDEKQQNSQTVTKKSKLKISLAQWSLHNELQEGIFSNLEFAQITRDVFEIGAIEYVSRFFDGKSEDSSYLKQLNTMASDHGVKQLLIMVDDEGGLAELDDQVRNQSIENHKKWIAAANALGCHSIRVNAYGQGSAEDMHKAAVDGLGKLASIAQDSNINVIVENHGGRSSNGAWLAGVMKEVNMENCGTLPDFGNFCIESKDGECVNMYDRYQGVRELMPYAKAVSAKSNDFDDHGNEIHTDFGKMIKIVSDAGYEGYIGIEYEGNKMSEREGVLATKKLLEKLI